MGRKRTIKPGQEIVDIKNLSPLEKKFAKALYEGGMSQTKIARRLGVSDQAISALKKNDGTWDEYKLPEAKTEDLMGLVEKIAMAHLIELSLREYEDETRAVLNIKNLISALWDLQKMLVTVSIQNEMISLQKHMEWLVKNPKLQEKALDAAQVHHDTLQKQL
jgi:predicted transcriptional regulator